MFGRFLPVLLAAILLFGATLSSAQIFSDAAEYAVGDYPSRMCKADFDGDGDVDLAITTNNYDYMPDPDPNAGVKILLNNGDGTFAAPVHYAAGDQPIAICCDDFDNDGDADLAVTNYELGEVTILENDGSGVFSISGSCAADGQYCRGICAADFDGDGFCDLGVVSYSSDSLSILTNAGDGTFTLDASYEINDEAAWVSAGDFDGDGDFDLAATGSMMSTVKILENVSGVFIEIGEYAVGDNAYSISVSDLDNDGDVDLAVAVQCSDMVAVLINNGDATFESPVWYSVLLLPLLICSADLDGDGYNDLAVTCHTYDSVSVLTNNGDGTFVVDSKCGTGGMPICICTDDFDGDGDYDLATANALSDDASILLNSTIGTHCEGDVGSGEMPEGFCLQQNYPNPFNPETSIEFSLPKRGRVSLEVFNIIGQRVRTLVDREMSAGVHVVTWDGRDDFGTVAASGMYLYRLKTDDFVQTRKMVLVK